MKKYICELVLLFLVININTLSVQADFKEHYDLGQTYMTQYRYTNAIDEFKNALRINYLDNSARINLINAYSSRATNYANNDKDYAKAADDFRSALFYLSYYNKDTNIANSAATINGLTANLDKCLNTLHFNDSPENRYATGKKLRADGNFSAAGYEFMQALGSKKLQKDSFQQVAQILKIMGNEPRALEYYKKAVSIDPTDLKLKLEYAKIADSQNDSDTALKEYSYVLSKATPEDKEVLYTLEKTFRKKVEIHPSNGDLYANLAAVLQKENQLDLALENYKKASELNPSNTNTRVNLGTLYQQMGDYKTAIVAYDSVLIIYPNNTNALFYKAQCYDKLGDNKQAQDIYKKVLALDPSNENIKNYMVESNKKTLTPEQFIEYVKANITPEMNPGGILYDYALELHKANNVDKALVLYDAAIKMGYKDSEIYINKALAQAQKGEFDAGIATLKNIQSLYPFDDSITTNITKIGELKISSQMDKAADAYNKKDYKTAIDLYKAVQPQTVDTLIGIATSYQELNDRKQAIEYYKKALALKPIDSDIAYYIACLYGEDEDFANAKIYLQKSITFNKNNQPAIEYLQAIESNEQSTLLDNAIALYDEQKLDDSLKLFNQVLTKDSNNAYALYYRGMIYDTQEKRNEAIADLKKAYDLNKEFTICNYIIASNYDSLGNMKEAFKYYDSYAKSNVEDDEYKKYAKSRSEELKEYATK